MIRFFLSLCWLALVTAVMPMGAAAQPALTPAEMVEQLKAPRTRSLRNLSVEAARPEPAKVQPGVQPTAVAAPAAAEPPPVAIAATAIPDAFKPSLSLLIQFDFNSARVKPESQQALANLAQALQSRELAGSRFAVEGHTDAKGGQVYNQKLSQLRADGVKAFLVTRGVEASRLQAEGKGFSELANQDDPMSPENRRVRIVNLD
jgi:outer membrane protein OmpA-like peptidoglycan-associated protein